MINWNTKLDTIKTELEGFRPLSVNCLDQLRRYYRVGLTYTSNALEGSTLDETETRIVVEDGLTISGKPLQDHIDAVGHAKAVDWMWQALANPITEDTVKTLHRLIFPDSQGQYRDCQVIITGSEYEPPHYQALPAKMAEFITNQLPDIQANNHPVDVAALAHWHLVTIHPFKDGNGRAARLLMNMLLLQSGYGVTVIPPVMRRDYINTLVQSRLTNPLNPQPFVDLIQELTYTSLKDYVRMVCHLMG